MTDRVDDDLAAFAHDAEGGRQLRRALAVIAQEQRGTRLGRLVTSTLEGRTSMRELAADPEFNAMAVGATRAYVEDLRSMSPEEAAAEREEVRAASELADEESRGGPRA